ncbi:MAG: response regulator [Niabella sp.]
MEKNNKEKSEYQDQLWMDFITNISHELKTPLSLIIAPLEELLSKSLPEKKVHKLHEQILANARYMYQLVGQLINYQKTEKGVKKLELSEADIVSFLREKYAAFLDLSRQKKIKYYFKSTEDTLRCFFDMDAIEKICNNLLSNAFKYTHAGDTIELVISRQHNQLVLTVKDTGVGIAPLEQHLVFERFYQVNNTSAGHGSGVGLAFTKSLVALHRGKITIESAPDSGTAFIVTLPLDKESYLAEEFVIQKPFHLATDPVESFINNEVVGPVGDDTEENISPVQHLLIIDDNQQIVEYLANYFQHYFIISKAFNGNDALKIMEIQHIDLVISDVAMPGIDGIQICKKIKQNILTCHIPVILLTARDEKPSQIKGLQAGADDYMSKPFSISVLEAKVQNIIRSRRRLKEYYSFATEIVPENIALNTLDEAFLKNAINIVENGISDPDFSVLKFSRTIGMSRSSLYLKLKAITGESTTDFIKRIKFKKAADLLKSKEYSITDVAYLSGFSSISYFSTSFKQYYGCLPTEYSSKKNGGETPLKNQQNLKPKNSF